MCWEGGAGSLVGLLVQALERDLVRVILAHCVTDLYICAEDTAVTSNTSLKGRCFWKGRCVVRCGTGFRVVKTSAGCKWR